jgi:hypothetical protein
VKIQLFSAQEGFVDLPTAIAMASGTYGDSPGRWRAAIHVSGANDDGTRRYGVEAWVSPRQVKFGQTEPYPAEVQISGLSTHDVSKARERMTCYAIAIAIADFVNRAATEGMDLGKAEDSGLLSESMAAIQDAIDEAQTLLVPDPFEDDTAKEGTVNAES